MKTIYGPILDAIFAVSGYTLDDLAGKSRKQSLVYFRKIFCLLCRQNGMTCQDTGRIIGRDHSTVLYSTNGFCCGKNFDPVLFRLLDQVKEH